MMVSVDGVNVGVMVSNKSFTAVVIINNMRCEHTYTS